MLGDQSMLEHVGEMRKLKLEEENKEMKALKAKTNKSLSKKKRGGKQNFKLTKTKLSS
jgi:hypothetical protein